MLDALRPTFSLLLLMTLITGVAYPLGVTAIAELAFPWQANGSQLVDDDGQVRGSQLLAQRFDGAGWFQPRPSAADYATLPSGASNLAPSSAALAERIATESRRQPGSGPVPLALVTTSGSGLDPDLSPHAAMYQIPRIAEARGIPEAHLAHLVREHTERPLFGPPVVNVTGLNRALAALSSGEGVR